MKNYVRADANGNFKKVGMTASNTNDKENEPREGYPYFYSDKESPINVAIRLDKPTYNRGDSLQLDIAVNNDSTYLACFYQDTSNTISQIYPNPLEPERLVSKNNPLKIPDSDAFNLSLSKKGKESVMCMASYYSVTDKLNSNLGAAFQPLKVKNMEQLANQLKSIFGEDIKGIRTVNYQVK